MRYLIVQTKINIAQIEITLIEALSSILTILSWDKKDETLMINFDGSTDLMDDFFRDLSSELLIDFKVFISSSFSNTVEETIKLISPIPYHQTVILDDKSLYMLLIGKIDKVQLKRLVMKDLSKDYSMEQTLRVYLESNQNTVSAAKKLYIHRNTLTQRLEKFKQKTGYDLKQFKDAFVIYDLVK